MGELREVLERVNLEADASVRYVGETPEQGEARRAKARAKLLEMGVDLDFEKQYPDIEKFYLWPGPIK